MFTRFFKRYVEYRRVGLTRIASAKLAWMVAWAGVVAADTTQDAG